MKYVVELDEKIEADQLKEHLPFAVSVEELRAEILFQIDLIFEDEYVDGVDILSDSREDAVAEALAYFRSGSIFIDENRTLNEKDITEDMLQINSFS